MIGFTANPKLASLSMKLLCSFVFMSNTNSRQSCGRFILRRLSIHKVPFRQQPLAERVTELNLSSDLPNL